METRPPPPKLQPIDDRPVRIALIGSAGVPGRYGGFETLVEQLARYHCRAARPEALLIQCSTNAPAPLPERFARAELMHLCLRANGAASIPYDVTGLNRARRAGCDLALLLGPGAGPALPIFSGGSMRIVTHLGGMEWKRARWPRPVRAYLRWCEALAVRHSDAVIADNQAIADHLRETYDIASTFIPYGGDHARATPTGPEAGTGAPLDGLPDRYALALCRIVPENNVAMILIAAAQATVPLVFVGNWEATRYGRALRRRYQNHPRLHLLDPIYEPARLHALRARSAAYVHGHCAGGTNPALVEMMHWSVPILAFDCSFNRRTTENRARYFDSSASLSAGLHRIIEDRKTGPAMAEIADRRYRWEAVGQAYFNLFADLVSQPGAQRSKGGAAAPGVKDQPRRPLLRSG